MMAVREEIAAGFEAAFPGGTQLRVYVLGLGQQESRNLPRPRGAATPYLRPRKIQRPVDDPRICLAVMPGQQTLFPVQRRLEREHARRISGRRWPEESAVRALAEERAAAQGLTATWPHSVMRIIRCALAIRDAEGEVLVAPEMLDQVRLPLKAAAAELLDRAGFLKSRTAPPPAVWPIRSCADCGSWGITTRRCRGCETWRHEPERYPPGLCPRCRREGLPVHEEGLCRGCLAYVREHGLDAAEASATQLSFAGPLAHRLKRRPGELGFVVHNRSGPLMRARARTRTAPDRARTEGAPSVSGQFALFAMARRWQPHHLVTTASHLPTAEATLLDAFFAGHPKVWFADQRTTQGAAAVLLRTLLTWVGGREPILERDVRSLAAMAAVGAAATRSVVDFLDQRDLLDADQLRETPHQLLTDAQRRTPDRGVSLSVKRRDRHDADELREQIDRLPEPMAEQMHAWVKVMRGGGRYEHPPAAYRLIRRYFRTVSATLTAWAAADKDLRQITGKDIQTELDRHRGNVARGLLNALRSIFRALKQERLIFHVPTAGLKAPAAVDLPRPLPSDRLAGALDRLDGPRSRLIVSLVAIHAIHAVEVARLLLTDVNLKNRTIAVRRGLHIHIVYLDDLSTRLVADWLRERRTRWPRATNPHLLVTAQTYRHPASPQISYTGMRSAFDQIGLLPRQLWTDRVLDEARETADPICLVRLFGIHPRVAVKYVHTAHPDKALPRIR
ncbi:hypothetical protein [Streptomyces sp. enrichment culture]|uniref:hypothetical protein n=1 Tax=Streptomyces sp. enrichment culture TaxID=1795815 RepID=UPI003F56183A